MKKVIFIFVIVSVLLFSFISCSKKSTLYEGVFRKGGQGCPNVVSITKSIPNGLPVNATIDAIFSDTIQLQQLKDGEKIDFKILNYGPDTNIYLAVCLIPQYVATIEVVN